MVVKETKVKKERDLFSVRSNDEPSGKKRKKTPQSIEQDDVLLKKSKVKDIVTRIEALTYQSLEEGQLILGSVREVRDYELLVSLPHKLMGSVPLTHISNAYTRTLKKVSEMDEDEDEDMDGIFTLSELYSPGQFLICKVTSTEKEENVHRVRLSLLPQDINGNKRTIDLDEGAVLSCAVQSVEDNGFIMDCGINNVRGAFLPKKHSNNKMVVGVGSVVRCVIITLTRNDDCDSCHLKLSCDPDKVADASIVVHSATHVTELGPGTLINTNVTQVCEDGLKLDLDCFEGVVSKLHLKKNFDLLSQYKEGTEVKARVLYITSLSRKIHLTLNKQICPSKIKKNPIEILPVGQVVEDAEVFQASKTGVCLKLKDKLRGFTSSNRLSDNGFASVHVKDKFPIGSKQICRILQYNYVDRMFVVSLQKSVIEQQILQFKDVKIGDVMQARIKKYSPQGAVVALSKTMDGFIPLLHLTDTQMEHPELKHPVGNTVTAKVIRCFPDRFQLHLTCKTALVKSKLPPVTKCDEEIVGTVTYGTIVKVYSTLILVELFNGIRGMVPKSMASSVVIEDLFKVFRPGQVVQCKVIKVEPEDEKMTLSLVIDGLKPKGTLSKNKEMKKEKLRPRQKVDCVVTKVGTDCLTVKMNDNNLVAEIPVYHLSDDLNVCGLMLTLFQPGDELKNVMIFKIDTAVITLTLKGSIYDWLTSDDCIKPQDEFEKGDLVAGVITEIRDYGLMAVFPKGRYGVKRLIHIKNMRDVRVFNMSKCRIDIGQSLHVVCKGKDKEDRILLTAQLSQVLRNPILSSMSPLKNYVNDYYRLKDGFERLGGCYSQLCKFIVGEKVEGTVTAVTETGIAIETADCIQGIIMKEHCEDEQYEIDQKYVFAVLNVNFNERCLELTNRKSVIDVLHSKIDTNSEIIDKVVNARVVLVHKEFAICMVTNTYKGLAVYLPTKRHINEIVGTTFQYKTDDKIKIIMKCIYRNKILGILVSDSSIRQVEFSTIIEPEVCFSSKNIESEKPLEDLSTDIDVLTRISRVRSLSIFSNVSDNIEMHENNTKKSNKHLTAEDIVARRREKRIKKIKERNIKRKEENQRKREEKAKNPNNVESVETRKAVTPKERKKEKKLSKKAEKLKLKKTNTEMMEVDEIKSESSPSKSPTKQCLELNASGFIWNVPQESDTGESSSDQEDEEEMANLHKKKKKRMSRAEQTAAAKEEERLIHEQELKTRKGDNKPETSLDYEALIANDPNSSFLWIQYVMHYLESAEVDKAKGIAKKAIESIDKTKENDQINVWAVLLKLEVQYGLPEDVETEFKEANIVNCPFKIHSKMAEIYNECDKIQEAEHIFTTMTRKFKEDPNYSSVWVNFFVFLFKRNMLEKARKLLSRAMEFLPKKEHVDLINKFAQLEFKFGDPEKGCTAFESLVSNYFKRTDIWSVYVDMLVKQNEIEKARHVLERMTGLKLKVNMMRFIFRKFIEFEKSHGTEQNVDAVKARIEDLLSANFE